MLVESTSTSHVAIPCTELTQVIIVGVGVLVEQGRSWQALADFHRYFPAATNRSATHTGFNTVHANGHQAQSELGPGLAGERAHMCGR